MIKRFFLKSMVCLAAVFVAVNSLIPAHAAMRPFNFLIVAEGVLLSRNQSYYFTVPAVTPASFLYVTANFTNTGTASSDLEIYDADTNALLGEMRFYNGSPVTRSMAISGTHQNFYVVQKKISRDIYIRNAFAVTNSDVPYQADTDAIKGYVNNGYGSTVTAVRDSGGTVLNEARQAKTSALDAYNEARTVNTKVDNVLNSVNNISSTVSNIQNNLGSDAAPPMVKTRTVSGAMATSGNSIQAVLDVSDNCATQFTYSLDGTTYQPLAPDGVILLPVTNQGANLFVIWVKDEAGNSGRTSITIRKL
ncbi:MAG: hypothetical protein ACOY40_04800 [Bacillota bacterium]